MHGNNYKHIKNEEKKRKRNCFKYNYSNFGVFFSVFFFTLTEGSKQLPHREGPRLPSAQPFIPHGPTWVCPPCVSLGSLGTKWRARVARCCRVLCRWLCWSGPCCWACAWARSIFVFLPSLLRCKLLPC